MNQRIVWVDLLRGICMLMILWFHTEMYYAERDIIPYDIYVANALTAFYFISGYVFVAHRESFSWRRKLRSIGLRIILPYFFFTTILAIPKALANHLPITDVLTSVLLGNASWFISSLIVAELLFISVLILRCKWHIYAVQIVCLLLAYLLTGSELALHYNYWNFHSALIGLFFLCLGHQYRQYEARFQLFNRTSSIILLSITLILIKVYVINDDISLLVGPVEITSYPVFIVDMTVGILLLIAISKRMPTLSWLAWTGRHSLVYYFFCGAVPMAVAMALNALRLPFTEHSNYLLIPFAFLLVYVLTTLVTWLAYRYLKFLSWR